MKIVETNKYRAKINAPNFNKGEIVCLTGTMSCENYPDVFIKLYEFEDGTLVAIGDTVFRIVSKGYSKDVKAIQLQEFHIKGEVEIFPTVELAKKQLEKEDSEVTKRFKENSIEQKLESISILSNIKKIEDLTLAEIKKKFENIYNLSKNYEI